MAGNVTIIPGLPAHLEVVPPAPTSPDDPERAEKQAAWFAWREAIILDNDRYQASLTTAEAVRDEMILCANHPAYWLVRWGTIFEARDDDDRGDESPFIPFAIQVDLLNFFLECLTKQGTLGDAAISKSRDMGASWVMCAFALWGWLFKRPWQVRLISYVQDIVDEGYDANPDTLFWKIDFMLDRLPVWMRPHGYNPVNRRQRRKLFIKNPVNKNIIGGMSSSSKSARARRATWVGFDEFAIFENGDEGWSSAANTTYHRFAVSSEHIEYGDHFQRIQGHNENAGSAKISLFPLDWWTSPHHDDRWYLFMQQRFRSEGKMDAFEREVNRNIHAGSKTWVYEPAKKISITHGLRYKDGDALYGSIDPGRRDQAFILWASVGFDGWLNILDGYERNGQMADYFGTIINGEMQTGDWTYDDEALRLIDWTKNLPRATWFGDTYGHNKEGATAESVYSRLAKMKIYVNHDRTEEGMLTAYKRQARTFRGRHEAAMEYLPRTRFADTPGAQRVLACLQGARYIKETGTTAIEAAEPMHDWTSHARTAFEFLCVHLQMRRRIQTAQTRKTSSRRNSRYSPAPRNRWGQMQELPKMGGR